MDVAEFKNPGKEYRGVPFWSWNDDLKDDELLRQIDQMEEKGWGGFFMHARVGLVTTYLSDEWMARIKACVERAKKAGMGAWLYDEDKWPSGYAGGIVPRMGPEYRSKALCLSEERPKGEHDEILALYLKKDKEPANWKRVSNEAKLGPEEQKNLVYLYRGVVPLGDPWFKGTAYVDLLNPKVTDAFLKCTHEAYRKVVGDEFGRAVPGIFTDEPCYIMWRDLPKSAVPWTDGFPEYFEGKKGYRLTDCLLSLFYELDEFHKIRYDYWRTVTELFVEAYSERMYKWCEKNSLKYTGHYLAEDTLCSQIRCIGAAMPHYEFMHYPGIDHLGRNICNDITAKQVSSVANQLGKERVLSEMYGCSGQNFSFEGRKWVADWHFVHGINIVNQHLSLYTMRGERKRDFPPNIFWQQPWWRHNREVADYMARLSYALSQGERVVPILVIHPIESAWAVYSPEDTKAADALNEDFKAISEHLLAMNRDFDYGDESIIARHGSIEDGKFCVGRSRYQLVIVPPSITLRSTTLDLLEKFISQGGKVIGVKPFPIMVEGKESGRVWEVLKRAIPVENDKVILKSSLNKALDEALPCKDVDVKSKDGNDIGPIWHHHRRDGDLEIYFFANTSLEQRFDAQISLDTVGKVEEWHPFLGERQEIPSQVKDGKTELELLFEPAGSHLIVVDRSSSPSERLKSYHFQPLREVALDDKWRIVQDDPNALAIDYCQFRPEGGKWIGSIPTWEALKLAKEKGGKFTLRYSFDVTTLPQGKTFFVLETPEKFKISVNDQPVSHRDIGWWTDTSFKKLDMSGLIRLGENHVDLDTEYVNDLEIEYCYVIGDFAVEVVDLKSFKIAEEGAKLGSGNLVDQGYPFFAGTVELSQEFELEEAEGEAFLRFDGLEAIVAEVDVNGQNAGKVFWRPHEVKVTGLIKAGSNKIKVRLTNSLRNLLGPHHDRRGELLSVGPGSFSDEANWTDLYNFMPFGFKRARLVFGRTE